MINKEECFRHLAELKEAKNKYDQLKKELEYERLHLKYSEDFAMFKTIKEKEERAKLGTEHLEDTLLDVKQKLRNAELQVQLDELEMYYFVEEHTCTNCEEMPAEEPQ